MRENWVARPLGEFSDINYGYTAKADSEPVGPRFLRITDIQNGEVNWGQVPFCKVSEKDHAKHKVSEGDIVFARTGATTGKSFLIKEAPDTICASYLIKVRPNTAAVLPEFLNIYFHTSEYWDAIALGTEGAAQGGFNASKLGALPIPLPPLEEQQRIVAVLDEAFEGLARARAHAEANLQDARELFERQLGDYFSETPQNWISRKIQKVTSKIGSGATPKGGAGAYKTEGISLIRSLNVHDRWFKEDKLAFIDDGQAKKLSNVIVEERDVLLNITGASIARCCLAPSNFLPARVNQHVSIIRPDHDVLSPEFLVLLLTSQPYKDGLLKTGEDNGATRQALTKALIQNLQVAFPSTVAQQNEAVVALKVAETKSKELAESYHAKLRDLDDLRQSLLQKAFAGELTASTQHASSLSTNDNNELAAQILALAYSRHLNAGRENTFGRVKAQKTLHLAEAIADIELGRSPIRDAAGPNDMPHMRQAEAFAKAGDLFQFKQRTSGGYTFHPGRNLEQAVRDGKKSVVGQAQKLTKLIDFITPMDTEEAEVFATVYAGWNNLIKDGAEISDEAIVRASREDWHADKLNIEREKFFTAIKRIKAASFEPDGTAKYVPALQERLL